MQKIDFVNSQQPALNDTNLNLMQDYIETAINAQVSGDTLPVGAIMPYASDTIPENWLLCNGQAVSRTTYATLFQVIGTTYGVGDGSTTFNLPNLKGKVVVGKDSTQTEFDTLGETGGEKTHTLTIQEMPSHNHTYDITANDGAEGWARNGNWNAYGQHTTGNTGGGQAHNNLQPYIVTNYIIKAQQSAGVVATVVDNLNSTSTTDALSANQGKLLNDKIVGVEAFSGSTNGNVTLTTSASGAKFAEIYYCDQENNYGYLKVIEPNGKNISLVINANNSSQTYSWIKTKIAQISGTSITVAYTTEATIGNGETPSVTSSNYIYIKKVILYF